MADKARETQGPPEGSNPTAVLGLPWARAAFNIAVYTLLPFGSRAVRRDEVTGQSDIGTGPLGMIGNQYTVDMKNKQGGNGALFTDADNSWGDGTLGNRQTVGVDAQYGTAMTWD